MHTHDIRALIGELSRDLISHPPSASAIDGRVLHTKGTIIHALRPSSGPGGADNGVKHSDIARALRAADRWGPGAADGLGEPFELERQSVDEGDGTILHFA